MNLILDLSSNNGSVDFAKVARAGIKGVYLKATEGQTWADPTFASRRHQAELHGLHVGAYHFARPDLHLTPDVEAKNFLHAIGTLRHGELRPCLDFETTNRLAPADEVYWARKFNRIVHARLGLYPLFYSYGPFIEAMHATVPIGAGLWLANYGRNDGREHPFTVPSPWKSAVMHQFSSLSKVVGVSGYCDLSTARSLTPLLAHLAPSLASTHLEGV